VKRFFGVLALVALASAFGSPLFARPVAGRVMILALCGGDVRSIPVPANDGPGERRGPSCCVMACHGGTERKRQPRSG